MRLRVDLGGEDRAAPAIFEHGLGVPEPGRRVLTASSSMFWPQGNLPTSRWRIAGSGQASANDFM